LLLIDTELTERKDGELLNTELRIVFDSLGIKDTKLLLFYDIRFLQFTTARYKNKAKGPREEFESKVIGSSKL
jgi:hypothetical protein